MRESCRMGAMLAMADDIANSRANVKTTTTTTYHYKKPDYMSECCDHVDWLDNAKPIELIIMIMVPIVAFLVALYGMTLPTATVSCVSGIIAAFAFAIPYRIIKNRPTEVLNQRKFKKTLYKIAVDTNNKVAINILQDIDANRWDYVDNDKLDWDYK